MDADYRDPVAMDIPNFVNARNVAHALATHASLSVLDGTGEVAVQDLFMMRRLADLSGSSPTLVGAMIRVAIMGIYTQTARDAIESGAFSDKQLKAIQDQLQEMNLLSDLAHSLRAERAIEVRLLTLPAEELEKLFQKQLGSIKTQPRAAFWQMDWKSWFEDLRFKLHLRSRAWLSENMVTLCRFHQEALDQMDARNWRIRATELDQVFSRMQQTFASPGSTVQLAARVMPNYSKASLTAVRNQTQLDQLRVACALERYRLAHGGLPEKLDALIPAYLDRVPNDLLADQPLKYRSEGQGGYQVWSVGWNEKDDGGTLIIDKDGKPVFDEKQGDWVWKSAKP